MANKNHPKPFRILSIDGGGVRGIIPARILQEIETRTGKRTHELFDLVMGNSTGGILALGLVAPDVQGNAKYTAADLVGFYQENAAKIFSASFGRKLQSGWGLWAPKYKRDNLDNILKNVLGNAKLSQTLAPALVTSYSLDQSLPHVWTTYKAKENPLQNYYLYDVAGSTSCAPTFFPPKVIQTPEGKTLHEVDGGLWANNPELAALPVLKAIGAPLSSQDVLIVSLGTGQTKLSKPAEDMNNAGIIGWLIRANLIDIMMSADSEWAEDIIERLYPHNYRLQVPIKSSLSAMDDSSPKNLKGLVQAAEDYLQQQAAVVTAVCDALKGGTGEVKKN